MMTFSFAIFIFLVGFSYADFTRSEIMAPNWQDRFLRQLELDMEFPQPAITRARRVPAPAGPNTRSCGKKLIVYVFSVCGEGCNPQTGKDIATSCCSNQCSEDFIKEACCP